jgi:apolipoprotein N-acyltransferase
VLPGAALWVLLDYGKAHTGFLSFPWASLAHSQYELTPLLQLSSITGEYGVTFLVVLVNAALAEWWSSRRAAPVWWALLALGAALLFGSVTLTTADQDQQRQITVAIVQPSILRTERESAAGRAASFARLAALTESAAVLGPELIILPETALRLDRLDTDQLAGMTAIAGKIRVPLIFGASESEKFSNAAADSHESVFNSEFQIRWHNSAFLSLPGNPAPETPYRKRRLVPFGEYNPLPDWLVLPAWLVPPAGNVSTGHASRLFVLPDGTSVVPVICWEILFADLIRDTGSGTRPDLIAHLTNSNWFGLSAAAAQQNSAAVFRAIEQRVPVAIAANTGPSVLIDAFGRRSASHDEMFRAARFAGRITPGSAYAAPFYQRNGNVFALLCLVLFCSISTSVFAASAIARTTPIAARIPSFKQERLL